MRICILTHIAMLPLNNNYFSQNYTDSYALDVNLTDSKLAYLEHSVVLSPAEKLHLLMLFMGMQVITDVGLRSDDLQMHQLELDQLGLPSVQESYESDSWILVGISQLLLKYLQQQRSTLSEIEAGIMYGYPATATLAFSGLIPSRTCKPISPAMFFMGGIYSKEFCGNEIKFYEEKWERITEVSHKITMDATEYYRAIMNLRN